MNQIRTKIKKNLKMKWKKKQKTKNLILIMMMMTNQFSFNDFFSFCLCLCFFCFFVSILDFRHHVMMTLIPVFHFKFFFFFACENPILKFFFPHSFVLAIFTYSKNIYRTFNGFSGRNCVCVCLRMKFDRVFFPNLWCV